MARPLLVDDQLLEGWESPRRALEQRRQGGHLGGLQHDRRPDSVGARLARYKHLELPRRPGLEGLDHESKQACIIHVQLLHGILPQKKTRQSCSLPRGGASLERQRLDRAVRPQQARGGLRGGQPGPCERRRRRWRGAWRRAGPRRGSPCWRRFCGRAPCSRCPRGSWTVWMRATRRPSCWRMTWPGEFGVDRLRSISVGNDQSIQGSVQSAVSGSLTLVGRSSRGFELDRVRSGGRGCGSIGNIGWSNLDLGCARKCTPETRLLVARWLLHRGEEQL